VTSGEGHSENNVYFVTGCESEGYFSATAPGGNVRRNSDTVTAPQAVLVLEFYNIADPVGINQVPGISLLLM
jgi:hypothetical protein